jgi:uncharacterized membrane protein YvbJ
MVQNFCPSCGSELQYKEAEICPKCGVRIKEPPKSDITPKSNITISKNVIILSYIAAIIVPLIGIILAFYFLIKGKVLHFIGLLVVSIFMWSFWWGFLSALV